MLEKIFKLKENKTNVRTVCMISATTKNSIIFPMFCNERSVSIKDDTIIQGEHTYISIAESVDRWSALAIFVLQHKNPGIIYKSVINTLLKAIPKAI